MKPNVLEQHVRKAGFTGGIVGIVGCGEPDRAVALAGLGAFLVHGLDADPDNVRRMRDAAAAAGRLFISTQDNRIVCLGQDGKGKAPGR